MTAIVVTERQEFYHRCESYFHNSYIPVQLVSYNDQEIKTRLETLQPDILLVDVSLGEEKAMHAMTLVRNASLATLPGMFVRMDERRPAWETRFFGMGAMYVFDAAYGDMHMVDSIQKIYRTYRSSGGEDHLHEQLDRLMRQCCLLKKHMGYRCIFDGVIEIYRDQQLAHALTRKVYPRIAQMHGTTAIRVEKNIRDAIGNAWVNGGRDVMPEWIGCSTDGPPTNGEFMLGLCERMREYMYQNTSVAHRQRIGV